jgi:outer membrane autotransporter protein
VANGTGTSGTLNINGGSTLETGILRSSLGAAQVNFDNAVLRATIANSNFINGFSGTELNIAAGGLTIDTATFAVGTDATSAFTGTGGLAVTGGGSVNLLANNLYSGATWVQAGNSLFLQGAGAIANSSRVIADGTFGIAGVTAAGTSIQSLAGSGAVTLGAKNLTITNANDLFSGIISGAGGLTVSGGTQALSGVNTYTGGTTVSGGLINFSALGNFGTGVITLDGGGLQWAPSNTTDISSRLAPLGAGGGTFDTNGNNVTFGTGLTGTGGLTKQGLGLLNLAGNNTYTGPTSVTAGTLAVNGSITSNVTVGAASTLGGNGIIGGSVVNTGMLAPGNSIGLLTVTGNYTQAPGSVYQVEVNAAGQSDRINVGGTATIQGGTVQVLAQSGTYARNTTYTILNATGGVSGAYSGTSSNFAFLTPSLSYDANNVYLLLAQNQGAFAAGAQTSNQYAVGTVLDQVNATATGDLDNVLNALSLLSNTQGPAALNAISGQPYADFGTTNVNNAAMFMNALGQQMANARGTASTGQRQALAQACEIETCDAVSPLSAWASALGGLGSVLGDGNTSTLTYNFGGVAAGIDYRFDPRFLLGIGAGYTHGTQWVNSFMGQGWSDSVSVAAYGSFTQSGFYLDALAGYAYFNNQLQRQIVIAGLQPRTATGSTGANQFLGQAEAGYKVDVYAPAAASITPFGRLQISSVTQNAFSESGAQSVSLNVAQQTTNSLRTTIGADLASSIGLGNEKKLDLALRLGWQHEFADTGRPITAAFAGAPGNSFTVFGATPTRDSAVIGFQAATNIAEATKIYLRYDGGVGGGTDNHALNLGVRFSW